MSSCIIEIFHYYLVSFMTWNLPSLATDLSLRTRNLSPLVELSRMPGKYSEDQDYYSQWDAKIKDSVQCGIQNWDF